MDGRIVVKSRFLEKFMPTQAPVRPPQVSDPALVPTQPIRIVPPASPPEAPPGNPPGRFWDWIKGFVQPETPDSRPIRELTEEDSATIALIQHHLDMEARNRSLPLLAPRELCPMQKQNLIEELLVVLK